MYLGIDVGSVSVKTARVAEDGALLGHVYRRHYGKPLETARQLLDEELGQHKNIANLGCTGSGGKQLAELLGIPFENEMLCQARAAVHFTPGVKSLIVVGGEDSFMIMLDEPGEGGAAQIRDFAMNGLCAAGCGSFLDQQASRLGVDIEGEFGALALTSARPARVAGRCSVFAKTDMIHLQQQATPVADIVAGLCFAFARNFVAVLARGKEFAPPVVFHGGVARNAGMVRAFRDVLGLAEAEFLVPEHAATAGAAGAALLARQAGAREAALDLAPLIALLATPAPLGDAHVPLPDPGPPPGSHLVELPPGPPIDAYLGVDVGSISTNVVLIDADKRVLAKSYLMTAGRPIEAVRQGLTEVGAQFADRVTVRGVCTTGSGRYLIGDFLGADLVKNEITAQARAAAEIDPRVDTIFEIGGQDSKYISLENGAIVDFEMNKVCAAGTGSFLEEQAERLGVSIKGEFAALAFSTPAPVRLGERCTVFMESDLVGQQARGAATADLAAGLAYSIVHNYLNRVVGERKIGEHIFFQGGTAFNRAVVAAFGEVTGKPITVPEHHEVTGAIGCALMAREHARADVPSTFKGWDLSTRQYTQDSFTCKACANQCEINRVLVEGEATLFYGGRCEKYEKRRTADAGIPDLFAERDALLLANYREGTKTEDQPLIGIPRTLHFSEYLPFWLAFFDRLGLQVLLSGETKPRLIEAGLQATMAEFCFPMKVAHGHALELLDSGATHLFLPCLLQLPKLQPGYQESVPCPYVTSLPFTLKAALDPEARGVTVLAPPVDLNDRTNNTVKALHEALRPLGITRRGITRALEAGHAAQAEFAAQLSRRGKEIIDGLAPNDRAVVIVSRPYNGCDNGVNLELPTRFRELGILPIPIDMLPVEGIDLSREFPDLTWRYGQRILAAAEIIRQDARLHAAYLTNFGCGPDSFLVRFFGARLGGKTFLQIEIDEHSSDVGAITRCEAFLDSLPKNGRGVGTLQWQRTFRPLTGGRRTIYLPSMSDEAHAIAAAFRSVGQPAEVLPESDGESVTLGKRYCSGKECFPCLVTTGDLLRLLKQPGVDPSNVAFFMPSVSGGCRFGYYNVLQRLVLDELGHQSIPIYSPNQSHGFYESLGAKAGDIFIRRSWQGLVAIELLTKALHHARPYEQQKGVADVLYQAFLERVAERIEAGQELVSLMREAREAFAGIHTGEDGRPWIGMVGEVFIRTHRFSNQQVIRKVEELGGRVWLAPLTEWIYYINKNQREDARQYREFGSLIRLGLVDKIMRRDEHALAQPWEDFLPNLHELPPEQVEADARDYIDPAFRGEAVLSLGKAVQFQRLGLAGIINVMPFTCMPGTISSGIFKRLQQEHDGLPVLNLAFDGQEAGDLPLRLEAFLQQCRGYEERRRGK
ncbi:MAG: acyl-CoA dehydratase activase [Armatimonadota bacterium]